MDKNQKNINDTEFDRLWEITKEINENIRHYNEHQTKYRVLASQWLIAAMAGIGFLFDAKTGLPFNNLLLIFLISLISASGILQLWRMDLVVLQRIIASFFSAGFTLEQENPSLPQIKARIYKYVPHKNAGQNLFYFYYFMIGLFLLLALLSFIFLGKPGNEFYFLSSKWIKIFSVMAYIIILVFIYRYMWNMSSPELNEKKLDLREQNQKMK
jgi:hypothetical protein